MLSENTAYILEVALANEKIADEVAARLISTAPADAAAAQAILDILDLGYNEKIEEYLTIALTNRAAGKEISQKISADYAYVCSNTVRSYLISIGAYPINPYGNRPKVRLNRLKENISKLISSDNLSNPIKIISDQEIISFICTVGFNRIGTIYHKIKEG